MINYNSNTMNLRAATEFIGMVARQHAVEPKTSDSAMIAMTSNSLGEITPS